MGHHGWRISPNSPTDAGVGLPADQRVERVAPEVERLLQLGASQLRTYDETGEHGVVLQDPERNEFCVS